MKNVKKWILTSVLVLLACGVLSGGIYYWWLITPPPMPQTPDEAAALITSKRFKRLSDDRKMAYVSRIREMTWSIDGAERRRLREQYGDDPEVRAAMRDLGEKFVIDMARSYAEAPPAQKQVMLDMVIGLMEQDRARRAAKGDKPPTDEQLAKREEQRNEIVNHLADRAATGNPQHGAYVGGFLKGLQARRQQLGLPKWQPD